MGIDAAGTEQSPEQHFQEEDAAHKGAGRASKRKIIDDSSDDEAAEQSSAAAIQKMDVTSEADFMTLLRFYYASLFPYKWMVQWLSYGKAPKDYLAKREFSFTLEDDIYIRYLSFSDKDALMKEMQNKLPIKIDLGAVFTAPPKDHKTIKATEFQTVEKEIVFDIDMTDYDDIRTCCSGAAICNRCWKWMNVAVQVLDRALREDLGFNHLLWVYSGRRGIHCWLCDPRARALSNAKRSAVAEYLNALKGTDMNGKLLNFTDPLHPSLQAAYDGILHNAFRTLCLADQGILDTPERWSKVLAMVPDEETRKKLDQEFKSNRKLATSEDKWNFLTGVISAFNGRKENKNYSMVTTVQQIVFQYTYPRLDINVSKMQNHLLKSPFVIHPKTGRICVPFDPSKVESFNPENVPTISNVFKEVVKYDEDHASVPAADRLKGYEKTSLKPSFDWFIKGFLRPLLVTCQNENKAAGATSMEF